MVATSQTTSPGSENVEIDTEDMRLYRCKWALHIILYWWVEIYNYLLLLGNYIFVHSHVSIFFWPTGDESI